ncbi:hypothetical protein KVR01_009857 [Diaporthe batatas]|uniref:uncharacterized protein n=1 Tax=Diaporthe batatas TaxID=748121 RepID=UPI001D04EC8F|nr:uncharacterized protein KVR01_009857 [Diaporthe batatas]KAG8160321.1 hypothetical protein KVR01_009857 [Diaporthe batatas]
MKSAVETQPFLAFSDDPGAREGATTSDDSLPLHREALVKASATRSVIRDIAVCLLTSLVWALVIWVFIPGPAPASSSPPSPFSSPTGDDAPGQMIPSQGSSIISGEDMARYHNITSGARYISCGNSTEEARSKGCTYDTLLNAWVPAQCLDQEWIDEYQDDASWTAFSDVNLTEPLRPDMMGERDHYYTSIRDHINHCAMLWRKQFWTLFEGRRVFDAVIANSYHTEHCASFLSELFGSNRTEPTLVRVGFSGCWVREDGDEL